MNKTKLLTGILLVLAVLFAQVGTAFAAPAAQDATTITGTIISVTPETDPTGVTSTVLVAYTDGTGTQQSVRISLADAVSLGLVSVDTTVTPNVVTVVAQPGATVNIVSTLVIPDQTEAVHPIAAILADFFGLDPSMVNNLHEEGFGFGVIAQALWMQKNLDDASITPEMILQAKQNNDYNSITLPDGTNPTNWGQFKKALLEKKNNLGIIVSGHANNGTEDPLTQQTQGKGNGKDKNQGKGNGKNKNP